MRLGLSVALLVVREDMAFPWKTLFQFLGVTIAISMAPVLFDPAVVLPDAAGLMGRAAYALAMIGLAWSVVRLTPRGT